MMSCIFLSIVLMLSQEDLNTLKHLRLEGISTRETIINYNKKIADLKTSIEAKETAKIEAENEKKRMFGIMHTNGCSIDAKQRCSHYKSGTKCLKLSYQKNLLTIENAKDNLVKLKAELVDYTNKLSDKTERYNELVKTYKELSSKE
jgi:formylmethanofuran dehydrogenase subunit E